MSKIPFERFIITFLLFNKSIPYIIEKLKTFGYYVTEPEVLEVFNNVRSVLPPTIEATINNGVILDTSNDQHIQWLKHFGVYEFYDFILRQNNKPKEPEKCPEYFKWFDDCLWVHGYVDVMCLANILLFNGEPVDSIADVIQFKYRKKVGVEAWNSYINIFWDTTSITAKEAMYHCVPFQNNALIVRKMRSGVSEIEMSGNKLSTRGSVISVSDDANDGSDISFTFHNADYIKWKIGYRDIKIPDVKDFLEQVKKDSYYRYYETMSMTQSAEIITEDGSNDELGAFEKTIVRKRNVEEQRAGMAKKWLDLYLKADASKPPDEAKANDFFDRMDDLELDFGDKPNEKIVRIQDVPNIMKDVKEDLGT
jgi:hypothetical protein